MMVQMREWCSKKREWGGGGGCPRRAGLAQNRLCMSSKARAFDVQMNAASSSLPPLSFS